LYEVKRVIGVVVMVMVQFTNHKHFVLN